MNSTLVRAGLVALIVGALAGCGGGGGGGGEAAAPPPTTPPPPATPSIATLASDPANDTATNPGGALSVVEAAGQTVVTVGSPPKVNFTVISDGAVVKDLTTTNSRLGIIIAKLVPGTNGNPDQWSSYTYRTRTGAAGTFTQDYTDPVTAEGQLVYNEAGYYTYTFSTDITDPTKTNGVTYAPGSTHRLGIQLQYTNKAGKTVTVNPTYDFTIDASGKSVVITDAAKTRKVVDLTTCNECHNKLALHGSRRVDTQYCVLCHNGATTDHVTGNVVDFRTMVHKIHAGRYLHGKGETYKVEDADFSEVGFPANVRNCTKCHDSAKSAQGDNWKKVPSKEACLSCHQSDAASGWYNIHVTQLKLGASAAAVTNADCATCHGADKTWAPDKVHWVQELENTALYQNKIVSASYDSTTRKLTAKVSVVNPATGTAYDLREGCGGLSGTRTTTDSAGTTIPRCYDSYRWYTSALSATNQPQNRFGTFQVYLASNVFEQTTDDTTDSSPNWYAYRGVVDSSNNYTITLSVPAGAKGNARIVMVGSVAERRIDPISRQPAGAVPPATHEDLAYVPVKNAIYEINLDTGASPSNIPRRKIVSNDKCNACHVYLGIPMNPKFGAHAFHSGVRNNSENCEICHNWARAGSYTAMTDGTDFNESWEATRMVHGIHGGSKRTYPYNHGSDLIGVFNKEGKRIEPNDGAPLQSQSGQASEVLNFTAEVAYPGRLADCNTCHVNNAWQQNPAVLGNAIVGTSTSVRNGRFTNPGINQLLASGACVNPTGSIADLNLQCGSIDVNKLPVISPKAAVCTACHDSQGVRTHVINVGGGIFGGWGGTAAKNQGDILAGRVFEACDGCHAPGAFKGIDAAHGLK